MSMQTNSNGATYKIELEEKDNLIYLAIRKTIYKQLFEKKTS